jgi:hypothetical protein
MAREKPSREARASSGKPRRRVQAGRGKPSREARASSGKPRRRIQTGRGKPSREARARCGKPRRRAGMALGKPGREARAGCGRPSRRVRAGRGKPGRGGTRARILCGGVPGARRTADRYGTTGSNRLADDRTSRTMARVRFAGRSSCAAEDVLREGAEVRRTHSVDPPSGQVRPSGEAGRERGPAAVDPGDDRGRTAGEPLVGTRDAESVRGLAWRRGADRPSRLAALPSVDATAPIMRPPPRRRCASLLRPATRAPERPRVHRPIPGRS